MFLKHPLTFPYIYIYMGSLIWEKMKKGKVGEDKDLS